MYPTLSLIIMKMPQRGNVMCLSVCVVFHLLGQRCIYILSYIKSGQGLEGNKLGTLWGPFSHLPEGTVWGTFTPVNPR